MRAPGRRGRAGVRPGERLAGEGLEPRLLLRPLGRRLELEVQVRPGGVARGPDEADRLARGQWAPGTTFASRTDMWQYVQTWPSKACRVRPIPQAGSGTVHERTTTALASA